MSSFDDTIDPDETDDFPWDWSQRLGSGETIASHVVTITGGSATVVDSAVSGSIVTARLSGASGAEVSAQCRVTTSLGRILDDTWRLTVIAH